MASMSSEFKFRIAYDFDLFKMKRTELSISCAPFIQVLLNPKIQGISQSRILPPNTPSARLSPDFSFADWQLKTYSSHLHMEPQFKKYFLQSVSLWSRCFSGFNTLYSQFYHDCMIIRGFSRCLQPWNPERTLQLSSFYFFIWGSPLVDNLQPFEELLLKLW